MKSKSSLVSLLVSLIVSCCFFTSGVSFAGTLLNPQNFTYEGAFRVPRDNLGGDSSYPQTLARGGAGLAYNPSNNSLIITSRSNEKLAVEISIPTPIIDDSIGNLNTASLLQTPGDVANSQWSNLLMDGSAVGNGGAVGGLLVFNNRLIGSSWAFYDGASEAARSHFTASLDWATEGSQFSGMHRVGVHPSGSTSTANGGFVGGYMADVPSDWQTLLGFPALTGKGSIPVIIRTSFGPCAWGFDPDTLGATDPTPATFLVGYPNGHETLGDYNVTSLYYNMNTQLTGLAFPAGSDSVVFFGRHGLGITGEGDSCYGAGTSDIELHGEPDGEGNIYCYDPADASKGTHGYPYISQAWFYDANDLLDVKNGLIEPWDVLPYARWEMDLPYAKPMASLGGAAYDPSTQRIFISQSESDNISNIYEPYPIIHVYSINLAPTAPTCSDGVQNGDEAGVDCGGSCSSCAAETCSDGIQNQDETGIDCGGVCTACSSRTVNVSNLAELYAAFDGEQDGDEIVIASGTYTLNTTALSIDADNITVRSSTGNRDDVVIQGDAMSSGATIKSIFYFPQGAYGQNATIKDLSVGRVGWHAIFFNGNGSGNGTVVDNVRIFDCYEQFIKGAVATTGTSNVTVKHSLFEFTTSALNYYTGGIDAHSADGWLIQDNIFKNIQSPSSYVAEHAIHLWSNTSFSGSNIVERNKIVNCDRGIGVWNGTGTNIIRNNMISSNGSGIFSDVGIDIQNTMNSRVYNNSVWVAASGYYASMEFRGALSTGSYIANNLTNKGIYQFNGATGTEVYNVTDAESSWFFNPMIGDLHINSSVGLGISISGLTDDYDGESRTSNIDIGADQRGGLVMPPSNLQFN